ncbi:hypothetical protein DW322_08925 [Rhodococcus rhodnii]|uniref:Uncharacterized protein n=3 Tax=Rhodococcus rhodnii TaxID=38312 RepID=R7WQ50_9NOCA|nr:hypothetical protein [Rhodococcus rhodnii]EOM77442.1 hypothetical protein Rrhod_1119 [Rhodococcus rhodnii LMG 5362]TXG90326.1 hypothetical protein DW322_08925 [Rhodococcus rhodnii]
MKPRTFVALVGALVAVGGGAATESVAVMVVGFLIFIGGVFVKWPQSAEAREQDDAEKAAKQARRDERVRALARRVRR